MASHRYRVALPCPSDLAEAAALIAEGDGCGWPEATTRALEGFGFASIDALAAGHAARIGIALDILPPACDADGKRLLDWTRGFLDSASWRECVRFGWPIVDVFGVAASIPLERQDLLGLLPASVFGPRIASKLVAIDASGAELQGPGGRRFTFCRPSLVASDAVDVVPWWQSEALVDTEGAT